MLQLTPHHRLLLAVESVDFRRGIDGLAATCRQQLSEAPDSGAVFVFANRARTSVKILVYDGKGYWLCLRRFSQGKLKWWPRNNKSTYQIGVTELQVLLYQGEPDYIRLSPEFKSVRVGSSSHAAC